MASARPCRCRVADLVSHHPQQRGAGKQKAFPERQKTGSADYFDNLAAKTGAALKTPHHPHKQWAADHPEFSLWEFYPRLTGRLRWGHAAPAPGGRCRVPSFDSRVGGGVRDVYIAAREAAVAAVVDREGPRPAAATGCKRLMPGNSCWTSDIYTTSLLYSSTHVASPTQSYLSILATPLLILSSQLLYLSILPVGP